MNVCFEKLGGMCTLFYENRLGIRKNWKFVYGSLPKTSNTLNIQTPKIIAKYNFKISLKSRTVADFQKLNF